MPRSDPRFAKKFETISTRSGHGTAVTAHGQVVTILTIHPSPSCQSLRRDLKHARFPGSAAVQVVAEDGLPAGASAAFREAGFDEALESVRIRAD